MCLLIQTDGRVDVLGNVLEITDVCFYVLNNILYLYLGYFALFFVFDIVVMDYQICFLAVKDRRLVECDQNSCILHVVMEPKLFRCVTH